MGGDVAQASRTQTGFLFERGLQDKSPKARHGATQFGFGLVKTPSVLDIGPALGNRVLSQVAQYLARLAHSAVS